MIRKAVCLIVCFTVILGFSKLNTTYAYSASSYCLYDPVLKKVLACSNMHSRKAMASTTKIMTALIACELCDLTQTVTVTDKMIACEGSSIGLQVGDEISYKDLLYGLMLESGNDAALCLAISISGSEKAFSMLMNEKAKSLGMKNTNFVTCNGLDDRLHYSSAFDLALLTATAMQNDIFHSIVSTKVYTATYNNEEKKRTYYNHNRLLSTLNGCEGVKTGFTKKSGRCLVSSCKRNGVRLIAVTLNDGDDWNDHKRLYESGYQKYEKIPLEYSSHFVDVINSNTVEIKAETKEKEISFYQGLSSFIKPKIHLPKFLYSPVKTGQKIGFVEYYYNDVMIAKTDIVALENANRLKKKVKTSSFIEILLELLVRK